MKKHANSKHKNVAVFDIDGTIFRSSLLIELVEALIQEGIFPQKARRVYMHTHRNWLDRKDSYEHYIMAVVDSFNLHLKGIQYKEFSRIAKKVVALHRNRVYRFTRDLINDLKNKRYYLLAISHSPKGILDPFCKNLGFDKIYGMIYETDSRTRFTGAPIHRELMFDKAKILERAVEKEGLTLKRSVGVGDTESDIPFLKMVERPICFNPNTKLYQYARRAHWQVIVERKDVIYRI